MLQTAKTRFFKFEAVLQRVDLNSLGIHFGRKSAQERVAAISLGKIFTCQYKHIPMAGVATFICPEHKAPVMLGKDVQAILQYCNLPVFAAY